MIRMSSGVKMVLGCVLFSLIAISGWAQPRTLPVNDSCQVDIPDFIEGYEGIFGSAPPWSDEANLEQYPEPGLFAPGDLEEEDWPEALGVFPNWPSETMPVYVIEEMDDVITLHLLGRIEDLTRPRVLDGSVNLFQRVTALPGNRFNLPDFLPRLRPFIYDNCTPAELLVMTQDPLPGEYAAPGTLPAGRSVTITVTDERGNWSSYSARVEVVAPDDTRPVIVPNGLNEVNRRFSGSNCDMPWDCGLVAYWREFWECGVPFDDLGATAYDPRTGENLTGFIQRRIVGTVDTSYADPLSVRFVVRYWIGNENDVAINGLVERRVIVTDGSAPVITLGAVGGGESGAHTLWRNWPASAASDWEERAWVKALRETPNNPLYWAMPYFSPGYLPYPFNFVEQPWNDETAMPWRCPATDPYDEYLDVYDDCEGLFDDVKLDANVLVAIVKVRMASSVYTDGEETFYVGGPLGEMRNAGIRLEYGRPATGRLHPWYGYRIYYFTWDNAGNLGYLSRHVNPLSGEGIGLAEPTTITITCDGDGLQQLYDIERLDRAGSVCRGDITHLIRATGNIGMTSDGYYIPGTYYRYYTIDGGQAWPTPWRRTIIVESTPPEVALYSETGESVSGLNSALVVSWCEFLSHGEDGDTLEERADAWADSWWAVQPGYDLEDESLYGEYGYSAAHPCDDDIMLTSWVDVRGVGVLKNTMVNYARARELYSGPDYLLGAYPVAYELTHPAHNLARAIRPVFLLQDISLDLVYSPVIYVEQEDDEGVTRVTLECGTPFVAPEVGRVWDRCSGEALQYDIIVTALNEAGNPIPPEMINIFEPGVVTLIYSALIGADNLPAPVRTVELTIVDTTPPEIMLLGDETVDLECGDFYEEAFALAWDACDGDVTAEVMIGGDTGPYDLPGTYYRAYTVRDQAGNEAQAMRVINVAVFERPEITLLGNAEMTVECGQPFIDPGAEASFEGCDTDISASVTVVGSVDTSTPGVYDLVYTVPGAWGEEPPEARRTVTVADTLPPTMSLGTLTESLVYEDGFIKFECHDVFFDNPNNLPLLIEPADFHAEDVCAGDLGSVRATLADDEAGVMAWLWWLNEAGQPRWILELGVPPRPDTIAFSELPGASGDYLLLYQAHDGNGNWYPSRNVQGWPNIFDGDGYLNIRDESGAVTVDFARLIRIVDEAPPVLTLTSTEALTFECGDAFVGPNYSAWDACDGDISGRVVVDADFTLDMTTPGNYDVRYVVYDRSDNMSNVEVVPVRVRDTLPPEITVYWNGAAIADGAQVALDCGDVGALTYLAYDACDGDINESVLVSITGAGGLVFDNLSDMSRHPGTFDITLDVNDSNGLVAARRSLSVVVRDELPPEIELVQREEDMDEFGRYVLGCGIAWDEDFEPGFSAMDLCDGDLTNAVQLLVWEIVWDEDAAGVLWNAVTGEPITYTLEEMSVRPGEYLLVYTVADRSGLSVPPVDDEGVPMLFDMEGNLDIFDNDGNLDTARRPYLRWVAVESRTPPVVEIYFEGEDSLGIAYIECNAETWSGPVVNAYDACDGDLSDAVNYWIWAYDPVSGVEVDGDGIPVNYERIENIIGGAGRYVIVYTAENSVGVSQPPLNDAGLPDVYDENMLIADIGAPYLRRLRIRDTVLPVITLTSGLLIEAPHGAPFVEPGYTALDLCDGDITAGVTVQGNVDTSQLGEYELIYRVEDSAGNVGERVRRVRVVDPVQPEITLLGEAEVAHECGTVYEDAGATARDANSDDDLTARIEITGLSETLGLAPGTFVITYHVASLLDGGNSATATRTVVVVDTAPPAIVLRGAAAVTVDCHAVYVDEGVMSAYDECDGDLLDSVRRAGAPDTNKPGTYVVTFSVKDKAGNEGVATRTITVLDNCKSDPEGEGETPAEGEGEAPTEGEEEVEGEGETPGGCTAFSGCEGCAGNEKDAAIESLKRNLNDLLLIGLSVLVLVVFRVRR